MAALDTVQDYVSAARTLLQDKLQLPTYRYSDADIIAALNFGLAEARKLRPDLFIGRATAVPYFTTNDTTPVVFELMYRPALLNFIVGWVQARDDEPTQDQRASAFLASFVAQLTTLQA